MTGRLDAAEFERAVSWNLVIAAELLGKDTYRDEGKERCWGSFHVCRQTGLWYDFAASVGSNSSVKLIQFLKRRTGAEWSYEDSVRWLVRFLGEHRGTGQLEAEDGEWTQARQAATAALARHFLDTAVPLLPPDSHGAVYLTSRRLPGPYPEALRWLPNARPGEGALVMPLTANGRVTGILLTYIDPLDAKSLVEPARRRFNLEPDHPGAVMEIAAATPGTIDISTDVVICEGLESGLSINLVKNPAWRVIALPGLGALKHVTLKPEERRVIVFQDSDPKGHPAREGLTVGVDALLLVEKEVRVTEESIGDANDILRGKGLGEKELKRLLAKPAGAALSFKGKVEELSKLPETAYMQARRETAKGLGVPVAYLDKEVTKRRPKPTKADDGSTAPSISLPVDPPWTGPVPQLGQLLDRIVAAIRRYVVLQEWQAHIVATWVTLTFFVFDPRIDLQVMPRLAVQSAAINSGKTALLRIVCTLARHGKIYGRATSAGIYRALSQVELTLCLDEVEFLRNDPYAPMMQVLDSSHHREDANILLAEPQAFGPPIARELSTWAAMALACNGQLPGSLQSRSIVVVLLRALASEAHEFLEKRSTPELVGLRRELTAWAATIAELPMPSRSEMPAEVYNRDGDNWRPMYAIGRLAGGPWPERIREASLKAVKTETLPPLIVSLLSSADRAFREDPNKAPEDWVDPQPNTWLDTGELVARLVAQEGEPWGKINRGGPIDPYWLRTKFINLLDPPGAQDWWQPVKGGKRKHRSGYFYNQFAEAFRQFPEPPAGVFNPDDTHAETSPKTSSASGASREKPPTPRKTAIFDAPDGPGASGADRVHEKASNSAADEPIALVAPDAPGDSTPSSVCVPEPDDWGWVDDAAEQPSTTKPEKPPENREAAPHPPARSRRAKPNGPDVESSGEAIRRRLEKPGSFLLVTMIEGRARFSYEDGEPVLGPSSKPLAITFHAELFRRLGLEPVEGESLLADGSPQRYVLRQQDPVPSYAEGSVAEEIRQLHAANPKRSLRWIAQQCGQPVSVVREILGNVEGSQ